MHTIEIDNLKVQIPSSWQEMTPHDTMRVAHVLTMPWSPSLAYTIIRLLTPTVNPNLYCKLDDDQIFTLLPLVEFLKKPMSVKAMPLFRHGFRRYWLPDKHNILTAEYAIGEKYLQQFCKSGKEEDLNALVACLCRPTKWWIVFFPFVKYFNLQWNGDLRERYHSQIQEHREKWLSKIPLHKRLLVVWWLVQIRWEVQQQSKELYKRTENSGLPGDFIDAAMAMSEKAVFGNFEETMQTPLSLTLRYLDLQRKKAS